MLQIYRINVAYALQYHIGLFDMHVINWYFRVKIKLRVNE